MNTQKSIETLIPEANKVFKHGKAFALRSDVDAINVAVTSLYRQRGDIQFDDDQKRALRHSIKHLEHLLKG